MKLIVGIADTKVSGSPDDEIVTHALGSCLGIAVYDPVARVGGLLHAMLPDSRTDAAKAATSPSMFVDTGVPLLFRSAYELGARKDRIIVKVAGGAARSADERDDLFRIGSRNFTMLRKLLWHNGILMDAESCDVGGSAPRMMSLEVGTGAVTIRTNGTTRQL